MSKLNIDPSAVDNGFKTLRETLDSLSESSDDLFVKFGVAVAQRELFELNKSVHEVISAIHGALEGIANKRGGLL